jgi:hypothetical protein
MSNEVAQDSSSAAPEESGSKADLTNVERLKSYLAPGGVASALLSAWSEGGEPQARRARLLSALQDHSSQEEASNAPPSAD